MRNPLIAALLAAAYCVPAMAQTVLFDFNGAPQFGSLPQDITVGGITAHLSFDPAAPGGQGYSFQLPNCQGNPIPADFTGLCVYPNSIYLSDLLVSFPQNVLNSFSIEYAPQELATDSSATMKITAYMGSTEVGSSMAVAPVPGTWPTGTLTYSSAFGFDNVRIHYQSPPPTGGDYGVIFMADNMVVTPSGIPEPASMSVVGMAMVAALARRRGAART